MKLTLVEGHLLVGIGNRVALIDTGSPNSMSLDTFELFGKEHPRKGFQREVTPQYLHEWIGTRVDILVGCDILALQDIRIRYADKALDWGVGLVDLPIEHKLTLVNGSPVFLQHIRNTEVKALLDTGAPLAYISPNFVAGARSDGTSIDFYPGVGKFTSDTYTLSTALDSNPISIKYSVPRNDTVARLLTGYYNQSVSAVIGTQLLKNFDCNISWARKRISWKRR